MGEGEGGEIVVVRGNLKLTRGEKNCDENCSETKEWSRIIAVLVNNVCAIDLDSMKV